MASKAYCKAPSVDALSDDGWGGHIENDDECGETLPECQNEGSSSSEFIESSSSEEPESSSSEDEDPESSSSYAISSSSEEDVKSSSSEDEIDSSSSEDDDGSSSSGGEECGTGTGHCPYSSSSFNGGPYGYVEDLDSCECKGAMSLGGFNMTWQVLPTDRCFISRKLKLPRFLRKPGFFGDLKFGFYCQPHDEGADWKNVFSIGTNIPYVYQESSPSAYCYNKIEDYGMISPDEVEIQSFYVCMNDIQNYVEHDPDQGCSVTTYGEGLWVTATIDSAQIVNSAQITDVPWFWNEEQVPSNFSLQQLISNSRTIEAFENCKETIRRYYLYELLSSSSAESSSSSEETESSSSNESESSSSLGDDESSSSVLVESSSSELVYSSSDDGVFVAGGDQEYTPDQIFKDGLDNMEDGKCYSLNPARGTQHGWINTNAQDSWWWREVDCETGDKVDNNRVGACPGFPLDNVPSNPKNACFAYNGTCYKCNPVRGSECSNSWLWQGTFTSANVGWWYEKVDCYDPFGEEDVIAEGCIDESFLKKEAVGANYQKVADDVKEYYADLMMTSNKYDALGRMRNHGSTQRMAYFNKKIPYKEEKDSRSNLLVSGTIVASSDTLCNRLSSGEWVCGKKNILAKRLNDDSEFNDSKNCNIKLRRNYGIVENGNLVGGMTCAWPKVITSKAYNVLNRERLTDEYIKIIVHYTITSKTILGDNDHLTVKKGYVFPNGHVTTSAEENQFDKHENGHEFYNRCIEFDEIDVTNEFECTLKLGKKTSESRKKELMQNAIEKDLKKIIQSLLQEKININQEKIKTMSLRFHKDYGIGGYSENYVCPTN